MKLRPGDKGGYYDANEMGGPPLTPGGGSRYFDGQGYTGRQDPYANQNFRSGTPMYGQDYGNQPQPMYNMDMNRRNNMDISGVSCKWLETKVETMLCTDHSAQLISSVHLKALMSLFL
uniref:Uncharacterized protein n=1 Tax=Trichobilharzia regenti TaxID=157069 RepID=A0AA85JCA5_TRIRE|nr:unnamed protein product [Trichobilharzia regenti]